MSRFYANTTDGNFDESMLDPFSQKARSFADKFNVSKMLNFFSGGSTAPNVANKMVGNKDSGNKAKKDPLFSTVSAGRIVPIKKEDSVSDVSAKLYNLLKSSYERKTKEKDIENIFREHSDREKERRHQELLKVLGGFGSGKVKKKTGEIIPTEPQKKDDSSWIDKAITAAKFIPSVVGGIGTFILAAAPLLALAEAARQAGEADINDPEQGIIEPLKNTYQKLSDGDWSGALQAASKLNVFSAAAKTGLEFSKTANESLGNIEKWDKRREENREPEKEIATDKYRRPENIQKMIDTAQKEVDAAKSPAAKTSAEAKLKSLTDWANLQQPTAQQVPSPTPQSDRANAGTQTLKDSEITPAGTTAVNSSTSTSAIAGQQSPKQPAVSPSTRNQDKSYKRAQISSAKAT